MMPLGEYSFPFGAMVWMMDLIGNGEMKNHD